ncbi:acyl-CoA carboxylase epsilon subunit [Streptomyces sp. NPDC018693]|uniref:acyl-CoA carboxylase epsilon subunit n=1 Tax=unclassified Streptomyces TaxID=2593676 RepID=UPI0037AE9E13
MTTSVPLQNVLRVEKGHAEPEELAALTAVLLARAAPLAPDRRGRVKADWRWWERELGFRAPHSWRR